MGSRMLSIIGATKWAFHPEGGGTKIVEPWGWGIQLPAPNSSEQGGGWGCLFKRKFAGTVKGAHNG